MIDNTGTTNYRDLLDKDGVIAQLPVGVSMLPMLKQRCDTIIVRKLTEKPKENDVVLYQRDCGKYVLHRVIKVTKEGYTIRGDNCLCNEYDIKDKHIFGILEGFYKKEKYIDCNKSLGYKIYVQLNRRTYYIRAVLMLIRRVLSKIKHIIIK